MSCKKCGKTEIDPWTGSDSKLCAECSSVERSENFQSESTSDVKKREWYETKWLWIGLGLLVFILIGSNSGPDKGAFSDQQICIATVAATMGRNPSIIKIDSIKGNVTYLSYFRRDDGTYWKYRCKLEGNRAIWASDTGRWRTDQYDSKITFSVNSNELSISEKHPDGSGYTKKYNIGQLGG